MPVYKYLAGVNGNYLDKTQVICFLPVQPTVLKMALWYVLVQDQSNIKLTGFVLEQRQAGWNKHHSY